MRKIIAVFAAVLLGCITAIAQKVLTGKVTDESGQPIPNASVTLKGNTNTGTVTQSDGSYSLSIPADAKVLVFSAIDRIAMEIAIGNQTVINASLAIEDKSLREVVVTALGIKRDEKSLSYASQSVKSKDLNLTQNVDIKNAIAGKVAGVQINGQAGAKLGETGKIRLRAAVSLTSDEDPIYVLDGVVIDPNSIDMDNIESVTVLKGPNATALYGQRAEFGVIVLTLKKGSRRGLDVELNSTITFDKLARTMKYQNLYGQGYEGAGSMGIFEYDPSIHPASWQVFNGKRYIVGDNSIADESWGVRLDGGEYVPWYAWWTTSPYYGQTAPYKAYPNNIRDFYNTGRITKNTVTLSGGSDNFSGRFSYTNLDQQGITPFTWQKRNFINSNFSANFSPKFKIESILNYSDGSVRGDIDDAYGNQTSGTFNSWFARQLDVNKMRELKDLQTEQEYHASWNWWGADYFSDLAFGNKLAFWFNPYTWMEHFETSVKRTNLLFSVSPSYEINKDLVVSGLFSRRQDDRNLSNFMPHYLSKNASGYQGGYTDLINGFGLSDRKYVEDNYDLRLSYKRKLSDKMDMNLLAGIAARTELSTRLTAQMNVFGRTGGLVVPDVYNFRNASITPTPISERFRKKVNSEYGLASFGYNDKVFLDLSARHDVTSALPNKNNSIFTFSAGTSIILSNFFPKSDLLSFAKFRAGIAQIGSDLAAGVADPEFRFSEKPYKGSNGQDNILGLPSTRYVDPNLKPAINSNIEIGLDLKFLKNRLFLSATYYNERRKDEIIPVTAPSSSGYLDYLTNSGTSRRKGIEVSLGGDIFRTASGLVWNSQINFARNKTTIESIAEGLDAINGPGANGQAFGYVAIIQEKGKEWGQLRGTAIKRDATGNPILLDGGLYDVEFNHYFGSVLPKFTGGWFNSFGFKNFSLAATIDFQKGGKFFSLTEQWGGYSGLTEITAALNDKGKNVRDDVSEGGGVKVIGVDADGHAVEQYVGAYEYFTQFHSNRLAEPFIHDASFIKLREVALGYTLDVRKINPKMFIRSVSMGVVARNLALISVAKDNIHKWDPSEMAGAFGEDGQLPGIRTLGVNIKVNF